MPGSGQYRLQPLHVSDVVPVLLAAAADTSDRSRIMPLLGEPITYLDFVRALARRVAPQATIVTVELEDFIRSVVKSSDPELSISELCVLISDYVGKPTASCFGETLPGLGNVIARVTDIYVRDGGN